MPDLDDESLNLENLDPQDEPAEQELEGQDEGEEPSENRGNLSVALRQEREKRREYEERAKFLEEKSKRDELLLQRLSQPQQQPDRDELNRQYQERLFQNPYDERQSVLEEADKRAMQRMLPALITLEKSQLATHPEYGDLYNSDEKARKVIDAFIEQEYRTTGQLDDARLKNACDTIRDLREGAKPTIAMKGKERATSIVDKAKSGKSNAGLGDLEIYEKVIKESSPKELLAWEKDPKNQPLIQRAKDEYRKNYHSR